MRSSATSPRWSGAPAQASWRTRPSPPSPPSCAAASAPAGTSWASTEPTRRAAADAPQSAQSVAGGAGRDAQVAGGDDGAVGAEGVGALPLRQRGAVGQGLQLTRPDLAQEQDQRVRAAEAFV